MSFTLIIIIIAGLAIVTAVISIKLNIAKNKDLKLEKERSGKLKNAMVANVDLADKANEIDKEIEVKKNVRKKLSKKDKISAANNRNN